MSDKTREVGSLEGDFSTTTPAPVVLPFLFVFYIFLFKLFLGIGTWQFVMRNKITFYMIFLVKWMLSLGIFKNLRFNYFKNKII